MPRRASSSRSTTPTSSIVRPANSSCSRPAHTITGRVYVFGQTDLAGFVDSTDPRFVPVVDVTTRSLADRRIVTRYDFVLINRTQMIAAAEIGQQGDTAAGGPARRLGRVVTSRKRYFWTMVATCQLAPLSLG